MFCLGSILSAVTICGARGNTQAGIVTKFLKSLDSECEELSKEAASNLSRGVKNPSIYVMDAVAALSEDSYEAMVHYFHTNILNLIKENERNTVRDALILMIQEDLEIRDNTIVDVIAKTKKQDLSYCSNDFASFLTGIFFLH